MGQVIPLAAVFRCYFLCHAADMFSKREPPKEVISFFDFRYIDCRVSNLIYQGGMSMERT